MSSYEQIICDAIDLIVDKKISNAQFDKTIVANVVECIDKTNGTYKVQFQNVIYVVSSDTEILYPKGTEVYVLIPNGEFSKPKKIIGKVSVMGSDKLRYEDLYARIEDLEYFSGIEALEWIKMK